ncbi:hypothetical protein EDC23_0995 [Thiohalophilus thiocyanatoxydans]|uniref:Uncharacterized protein n=1 Tax=Thiohalophilus thiocyanatoxydans TaxID=381308 RepID=A0A4R8IT93_9GAMM|nr:hypothetical protein EDC23_0995 [Thiohalophilus thiocyanatoxydans]
MVMRATLCTVLGVVFLLASIYGLMGVLQAASLFVGVRALLNANLWGSVFLVSLVVSVACFVAAFRTQESTPSRLSSATGLVLFAFSIWFVIPVIYDLLAIDSCLDRGGSFDYVNSVCDFSTNHPNISIFSRHGFRLTTFVIFSLVGLKLLVPYLHNYLSRRKHAL